MHEWKFTLSLLDNAEHSFITGVEHLKAALEKDDPFLMKEAILNVAHGIELTLKQLVVKEDPLFIFDDPGKAIKALMELRMAQGSREANFLDLLSPEHDVITVGYRHLVDRAARLLLIKELLPSHKRSDKRTLRDELDDLVAQRNRLMHSMATVDMKQDAVLLLSVVESFYRLASRELDDTPFRYDFHHRLDFPLRTARHLLKEYEPQITDKERWILSIVQQFDGQTVPGKLFGQEGAVQLPSFRAATIRREPARRTFLVSGDSASWLVVSEGQYRNKEQIATIISLSQRYDANLWLVASTGGYRYTGIHVSTTEDAKQLEEILATGQEG